MRRFAERDRGHRGDIDGLRAYAVIPVVLFHAGISGFSGGFVGVDVFFVISGFLITKLILDQLDAETFSLTSFYLRRVRRLFPALWVTIATSMVVAFALFSTQHFKAFGGSAAFSILPFSNIWFWSEAGYWDASKYTKPLLHTWSLSVEEQFYLIWPLLLMLLFRFGRKWMLQIIVLIGAASLIAAQYLLLAHPETVFYWMPFRVVELAAGAAVLWLPQTRNRSIERLLLLAGLGLIVLSVAAYSEATPFPGLTAMLPCIGAALAIHAGRAPVAGRLLDNPVAVRIGRISYSLYLVHWPIVVFWRYYVLREPTLVEKWGIIAASLALASCMYLCVEQPFRRGRILSLPAFGLVCAVLALLIVVPAQSIFQTGGWQWRLPPEARNVPTPNYGGEQCEYPYCSSPGGPEDEYVVTGDSFGRMYYAGLSQVLSPKRRFSVFHFDSNCNFFQESNFDKGYSCSDRLKTYLAYISSRKIKTVILAHRWTRVGDDAVNSKRGQLAEVVRADFIADQLQKLIKLPEMRSVSSLAIVLNPPEMFLTCDPTPTFIVERHCDKEPIESFSVQRMSNDEIRRAVTERHLGVRVTFIDPFDQLCDEHECTFNISWQSLYSDQLHLSEFGSRIVVRQWKSDLDALSAAGSQSALK